MFYFISSPYHIVLFRPSLYGPANNVSCVTFLFLYFVDIRDLGPVSNVAMFEIVPKNIDSEVAVY